MRIGSGSWPQAEAAAQASRNSGNFDCRMCKAGCFTRAPNISQAVGNLNAPPLSAAFPIPYLRSGIRSAGPARTRKQERHSHQEETGWTNAP